MRLLLGEVRVLFGVLLVKLELLLGGGRGFEVVDEVDVWGVCWWVVVVEGDEIVDGKGGEVLVVG